MHEFGIRIDNLAIIMAMVFIIVVFFAWKVRYNAKAKERLLIIEKDFDLNKLVENKKNAFDLLKTGIIFIASSVGALIGFLIIEAFSLNANEETIFFISIFLSAGIGMIIASKVGTPKEK